MRRTAAVVLVLFGLALVAGVPLSGAFGKATAGQRLLDGARPTLSEAGLRQLRADFDTLDAGLAQTVEEVFPAVAGDLGLTRDALLGMVEARYPATAAFLQRRAEVTDALDRTVTNLEAHQQDFRAADALPAPGAPLVAAPIAAVLLGGGLLALGVAAWRRPTARGPWAATAAVGLVAVVATVALQIPQRTAGAEAVLGSLRITPEAAATTRDQFELTKAATTELRDRLLPDVASALGATPAQFDAVVAERFPAAAAAFADADVLLDRVERDVRFRERVTGDFAAVRGERLQLQAWCALGAAAVLVVLGGLGLRRPAPPRAVPAGGAVPGGPAAWSALAGRDAFDTALDDPPSSGPSDGAGPAATAPAVPFAGAGTDPTVAQPALRPTGTPRAPRPGQPAATLDPTDTRWA